MKSDSAIIERLKAADEQGLSLMMEEYGGYVCAVICNLSQGMLRAQDAEELAADVFVSVWYRAQGLRGDSLRPYLAQAARNAAVSRLRAMKREPIPLEDDLLSLPAREQPDELAERREQEELVREAVEAMPPGDRELFLRFYFFGESVQAIAGRLGLTAAAAKTRLHRCRKKIKQALTERGYGHEGTA